MADVRVEVQASQVFGWKELVRPSTYRCMGAAITIQHAQELTGATSLAYYAPHFFALLGTGDKSVCMTGFFD